MSGKAMRSSCWKKISLTAISGIGTSSLLNGRFLRRERIIAVGYLPNSATFCTTNSVISTGTFDILQDTQLRKELDQFLNLMEDTHEDIQNMLHFMRLLGEYEVALGGPWGDPGQPVTPGDIKPDTSYQSRITTTELLALLRNPGYVGRVKLYHGCAGWYCGELGQLAEHTRKVLTTITNLQN